MEINIEPYYQLDHYNPMLSDSINMRVSIYVTHTTNILMPLAIVYGEEREHYVTMNVYS